MKTIFYELFLSVLLISCETRVEKFRDSQMRARSVQSVDTLSVYDEDRFAFQYDSSDEKAFGARFFAHDLPIGESAVTVVNDKCFIVDSFHGNVKVLNIINHQISNGKTISFRGRLSDIIAFNDLLYVASELDTIFILDKQAMPIGKLTMHDKGEGRFYKLYEDSLIIHYPDHNNEFITIDKQNRIIRSVHGFKYESTVDGMTFDVIEDKYFFIDSIYFRFRNIDELINNNFTYENRSFIVMKQNTDSLRFVLMNFRKPHE